ncbi:Pol polyprotein [Plakobranchus ocellatus]|uniref:Pol polyprotein n=1 Tax=Plakobranchus ocellatus TaxID=259542 RepID=A0AAV4CQN9_9GAST|nr:Pol polyprotein [Plakobranchus ocellatus]
MDEDLTPVQKLEVRQVLEKHSNVLTDVPGKTDILKHEIRLTDNKPFRVTQYATPFRAKAAIQKELNSMLEQDIIRPSTSPYCSPITVVNKPDGSIRLCIDFRKLNSITEFDNEPIPQLEEIMTRVHRAKYFSKLDMTKGYFH